MKTLPPRRRVSPGPSPIAAAHRPRSGHRLKLEITLALTFKVLVLGLLWFMFFRPDPYRPKPERSDLFTRSDSLALKENRHDDR